MAGDNPRNGSPAVTPPGPALTIRFAGPNLAEVASVEAPGVTLGQLYLAAWLLEAVARENRQGELVKAQLGGVVPPELEKIARNIIAGGPRQ